MAEPADKAPAIESLLEETLGRSTSIRADRCLKRPWGCAGPATEFRDELSRKEFTISGYCQACQDRYFKEE